MTATTHSTDETRVGGAPSRWHGAGRAARKSPVSIVLALALLCTSLAFGTLWGDFPDDLAAGVVTTVESGAWWTVVTALLVPDSAVETVLSILLALTIMAFVERRIGSRRTVALYFGLGVAGLAAGIGLQAAASATGDLWGRLSADSLVLDPAIGIIGVVMAGTAAMGPLGRRRVRLIGFTVLAMFALYAGDADAVYRLVAGLLGLVAGSLLFGAGGRATRWRRSSYRETRTLVAAVVAATGLGPIIVVVGGFSAIGPLSLTVSSYLTPDAQAYLDSCSADDAIESCDGLFAHAMTTGPGPMLLSLVPFALSLVAARGLHQGRRAAWMLAIVVESATALLLLVLAGTYQIIDPALLASLEPGDWEYVVVYVLASLLPVAMIALLVRTRRYFGIVAPRPAARRFALVSIGAAVVLMGAYTVVVLTAADASGEPPTLVDALVDALRRLVPAGFLIALPSGYVPATALGFFVARWIGVVFWVVLIAAVLLLYRAAGRSAAAVDADGYRALLERGGGGTLGFMGTWRGNEHWFAEDGRGAVAYRVIGGIALSTSDPVCDPGDEERVVREFVDFCERNDWSAVFYSVHETYLPVFDRMGWQRMSVGEETVIDLSTFQLVGKPWQKVRQALNKGKREGLTTVWSTWSELPLAYSAQINAISEEWVAEKELPEMGFTLGGMEELKDPDVRLYLAIGPDDRIQAITSWLPSWRDGRVTGWTIDFMRRGDDSMNGVMEFVITAAALHMKELGAEVLSLSGAPLAVKPGVDPAEREETTMTALLAWLGRVLEPAYGFTSLFRFKSKFNPRYDTIYMAYADPAALPAIGLAIGKAYLPEVSPKEYVALARTLTAPRD